jgi:hypothetical protein
MEKVCVYFMVYKIIMTFLYTMKPVSTKPWITWNPSHWQTLSHNVVSSHWQTLSHNFVSSHWQTLSHNVVSSTPRLSGVRTQNIIFIFIKTWNNRLCFLYKYRFITSRMLAKHYRPELKNISKVVLVRYRLYVNYKLGDPDERRVPHQSKTRPS